MKLTATITPGNLPAAIDERRRAAATSLQSGLAKIAMIVEAAWRRAAPIGPTGNYYAGVGSHVEDGAAVVGSDAPHAHLVTVGRAPGAPPPAALMKSLLGLPTINAGFLVARAIGRGGTAGVDVPGIAREESEGDVRRVARDVLSDIGRLR